MPKETFFNLSPEKRSHILETAISEFAERSYTGFSITHMVTRAGIAKGSFYQYFENKLDLYRYLLLNVWVERKTSFLKSRLPPSGDGFFGAVRHLLLTGIAFGLSQPRMAAMFRPVLSPWAGDEELGALQQETLAYQRASFLNLIEQGQAQGQVRRDLNLETAADLLMAITRDGIDRAMSRIMGMTLVELCARPKRAAEFDEEDRAALVDEVVDLLRRWLGVSAGAPAETAGGGIDIDALADTRPVREGP